MERWYFVNLKNASDDAVAHVTQNVGAGGFDSLTKAFYVRQCQLPVLGISDVH